MMAKMGRIIGLLAVGVAALAVATPHYAKRAYHAAQHVATAATTTVAKATATDGAAGATPIDPKTIPPTIVGMNVGIPSFYSEEEPLYDPVKAHGQLTIGQQGQDKPIGDDVKHDAAGWLYDLPKDTHLVVGLGDPVRMSAPLDCTISPGWQLDQLTIATTRRSATTFTVTVPPNPQGGAWLKLQADKDHTDLTKLECRSRSAAPGAIFRAAYLADMKPFRIIRFMNWMRANSTPPGTWANRPTPEMRTYLEKGYPLEAMVALANANHSDPWFTMPFRADEDYQRRFATYVRDHLDPGLKAYVEFSNEVWNPGFSQSKEAAALGKARYPSADETAQNDYFYADRVRETMTIWADVFKGQQQRIVRVASVQPGWAQRAENVLGHQQTWKFVDALAMAPYFGDVPNDVPGAGAQRVNGILAKVPAYIDQAIAWAKSDKAVANLYGLRLIAYEGGPGFTAYEPGMVADVKAAYHDPRFVDLYKKFLTRWQTEIGGEIVVFDYSGDGLWSHLDYTGQKWSEAPKMKGVTDFIATLPPAK